MPGKKKNVNMMRGGGMTKMRGGGMTVAVEWRRKKTPRKKLKRKNKKKK
jgi:hypothetical protein